MKFADAIYNGKIEIKNIIFDWGGVITDLHFDAAKNAFTSLGLHIFDESVPHDPNDDLFIPFETGKISSAKFRERVKGLTTQSLTDNMIDDAWNALLGDLPEDRWNILKAAGRHYRIFLLSNTNDIHLTYYYNYIRNKYGTNGYDDVFEKVYYSYKLGMRKPNEDIFKFVLDDAGIIAEETMFIDDFIENIHTARLLGFQTIHMKPPVFLTNIFENQVKA